MTDVRTSDSAETQPVFFVVVFSTPHRSRDTRPTFSKKGAVLVYVSVSADASGCVGEYSHANGNVFLHLANILMSMPVEPTF